MRASQSAATAAQQMLPPFYPIIDTAHLAKTATDPADFAAMLLNAGVRIGQYRHKGEFTRARFDEADAIAKLFRNASVPFIVNDRADIALAVGANGVHVGQDDLPPAEVRRLMGPEMILGFSTHTATQLQAADFEPIDYVAIGPIYGTTSKDDPDRTVGIENLSDLRRLTKKPLAAIGGISLHNCDPLFEAGIDSVAVISAITSDNVSRWVDAK